ncbi:BphX family protein [Novosphingobium sp. PP1Y]|uniref:BphX family protein n=1 Tax=Novosphingobium sp. PP1Y TaxID=702113 RepID=UPI00020EEC60|nr:BphX family protein [Novosphingobium sp. PP1Y]CCA92489.1 BphX family protein [Novosphingobium sp. PP1Y]
MQSLRTFFIACGIWYLCNLVLLWPQVYAGALPLIYPGIDLAQGKPVFGLLLDAWLIVGIQLAAIGVVALWGARQPWKYIALVPVIVLTEAVGAAWDLYSLLCSGEAAWVVITTLAAHAVIVLGSWYAWTASHRDKMQQG